MERLVVVSVPVSKEDKARIRKAAPELTFVFTDQEGPPELLEKAEVLFGGYYDMEILPHSGALRWLQTTSSGVGRFLAPGILEKQTLLTSATGIYGKMISEFMLGQILALNYKLHLYRDQQPDKRWQNNSYPHTVGGKTVLIFGLGDIGGALARLLKHMGATVIGVRRANTNKPSWVDVLYLFDDPALNDRIKEADIVAMCMPKTSESYHTLSRERIGLLKESAMVINVGRGSAIDEPALIEALQNNRIAGAALDVFVKEPLPQDNALWGLKNVLLTPHVAGQDEAPEILNGVIELFIKNLMAYSTGQQMESLVDKQKCYANAR